MKAAPLLYRLFLLNLIILSASCSSRTRNAVPEHLVEATSLPGYGNIRSYIDLEDEIFINDLAESLEQERQGMYPPDEEGIIHYPCLALSGGGAGGAYSAGVITGWTEHGDRPQFKVVTGISTGAIIAPFAFVGEEADAKLVEFYTTLKDEDVIKPHSMIRAFFSVSLASSDPLASQLGKYLPDSMIDRVAQEHLSGRRLYVGTTNLDAQRLVIWNLGEIANSENPGRYELFRKIIFASAAVPGIFPPVYFDVTAAGTNYDEMHVDGGTANQVFFPYSIVKFMRGAGTNKPPSPRHLRVYMVRNGLFWPHSREVPHELVGLASRAIETFVMYQTMGDVYRLFAISQAYDVDFFLGHISDDYVAKTGLLFNTDEMRYLYEEGRKEAINGYPWRHVPPQWDLALLQGEELLQALENQKSTAQSEWADVNR